MNQKIKAWVERKVESDADYADDCAQYDNLVEMKWELPASLAKYSWVRKRVSTVPHDIIKQACNIFDTFNPKFELLPRGPEDMENAEKLERWGEWQMQRANSFGETEPFREILRNSVTYDRVCAQVEYVPNSDYPFCIHVYHPSCVHYDMGGGVVRRVVIVNNVYAAAVLEHWEPYTEEDSVKSAVAKLQELADDDDEQRVIYVDYTDKDTRLVGFQKTTGETVSDFEFSDDFVTILDKDNALGFVPWVVAKGSSGSILESLYKSGLVENQNFLDTMADTTVIRRGFFPNIKHMSATGKEMEVDYGAEANGVVELGPGEQADVMVPPPMDPGIREMMDRNNAKMNITTGVQNISAIDAANVQFATINAVIQLRMTELEPYKRNAEKILAGILRLFYRLADKNEKTLIAQRTSESKYGKKGEQIVVAPGDYDPSVLVINCTLLPNTPTDQMQKVNMYSTLLKMGFHIPQSEFIERLDFGNPDVLEAKWQEETVANTEIQAYQSERMQEVQLQAQAAAMQMQMQAQAAAMQAQGQQGNQNGQNAPTDNNPMQMGMQGGDMNNPNMMGSSPYEQNPSATQTQLR